MSRQPDDSDLNSRINFNFHISQFSQGPNGSAALNNRLQESSATVGSQFRIQSESDLSTLVPHSDDADSNKTTPTFLHERGDSLPDIKSLQAVGGPSPRDNSEPITITPNSPAAESPAEDDSDCLIMASAPSNDDRPDSQGTIVFKGGQKPRYSRISDRHLFYPGRLIQVSEQDTDQSVQGCAMIVLTVSDHGYPQCLMLCRHHGQEGDEEERRFWEAHSAVYSSAQGRKEAYEKNKDNQPITVQIRDPLVTTLAEDCFVNYQHTWSLRKDNVRAAPVGKVQGEELARLREYYRKAQDKMYSQPLQ